MTDEQFTALVEMIKAIRATHVRKDYYDAEPMDAYIEKARLALVEPPEGK